MAAAWCRMRGAWPLAVLLFTASLAVGAPRQPKTPPAPRPAPFSELAVQRLLEGNEEQRTQGLTKLDERADEPTTVKLLKRVLDKESKVKGPVRESTVGVMQKLGKIQRPEVFAALVAWLKAPNYRFAMVAVDVLRERGDTAAIAEFLKTAKDPNFRDVFGFRKTVVDAVLAMKDRAAVDFAVNLLPLAEGIVRYDLLRYLITVTDQDFGNDQQGWATWWTDNREDFQFADGSSSYDPTQNVQVPIEGLSTPTFYGIKIYAKRIVFVIDTSSSMVQDGPRPPNTRLATAKLELSTTVQALPNDTWFTILAFNTGVTTWGKMVQASDETRASAIKWVDYLNHGRGTNSHDALMKAFAIDGNIEAIVFLSDGQPSTGVTDVSKILQDVAKENKARKISIYSIGIFTGQGLNQDLAGFMSRLAAENRGVYRQVN